MHYQDFPHKLSPQLLLRTPARTNTPTIGPSTTIIMATCMSLVVFIMFVINGVTTAELHH